jgi:hypothetical protein
VSGALKAVVAALAAALVIVQSLLTRGGPIVPSDWQTIADALLGPILVYFVPNIPTSPKPIIPAMPQKSVLLPASSVSTARDVTSEPTA